MKSWQFRYANDTQTTTLGKYPSMTLIERAARMVRVGGWMELDPAVNGTRRDLDRRTIEDFGDQWVRYPDNSGYYGSIEMLTDIFGPLLSVEEIAGKRVAEIGSGSGRIVNMLLDAGAEHVLAIEPSAAFDVLRQNTSVYAGCGRVDYLHASGENIPRDQRFDYVFSVGVLHHTGRPEPILAAAYQALKPGGRMLIWLYGREGNELYLNIVEPLRMLTTRLPSRILSTLCHAFNACLWLYVAACRILPLPLRGYCRNVLAKLSWRKRFLVIYDQLNPTVAKYYGKREARLLLEEAKFEQVRTHHRHGYSWTVIGTRL